MIGQLVVLPVDDTVRYDTDDAAGWPQYAAELVDVAKSLIRECQVQSFELEALFVGEPLVGDCASWRNGTRLDATAAISLMTDMARGWSGPYVDLVDGDRLRIQRDWDASIVFYVPESVGAEAFVKFRSNVLDARWTCPAPLENSDPFLERAADDQFWAQAAAESPGMILLRERWAHGRAGSRWFRLRQGATRGVQAEVEPRSLLEMYVTDALLDLREAPSCPAVDYALGEGVTAFRDVPEDGLLVSQEFGPGEASVAELVRRGFRWVMPSMLPAVNSAVVPDGDGVVRGRWQGEW